ncbi:MAG: cellulase-like family protein [Armatimonadota bacterium]
MQKPYIPDHLPDKLSICSWIWSWISSSLPDEPYGDLERAISETKARGFNCIRLDAGLNWCFDLNGNPRGVMEFGPWIKGYSSNLRTVNGRGGAKLNVLDRVIQLMELARDNGIYVIQTSWEYQDSTWHVVDRKIRDEVYEIPVQDRLMSLVHQHDRLITILKERGLDKNIAFVEPHNEIDHSEFPKAEAGKRCHTEAIAFLREKHPDILISADFSTTDLSIIPDNAQVFDSHMYAGSDMYFNGIMAQTVLHPDFDPDDPWKLPLLRTLLKENIVPWNVMAEPSRNIREFWRPFAWLYENLRNDEWDRWMLEHYDEYWLNAKNNVETWFAAFGKEADRRGIPAVLDEGGWFYPPLGSRFEEMPEGMALFELMADHAIINNYWGFMPTTYCGPEQPVWNINPEWLKEINTRFQNSILGSNYKLSDQ